MKPFMRIICVAAAMFFPLSLLGQLVCIGDGACSCDKEKIPSPNLLVAKSAHIVGTLIEEQSGLPFVFENTIIQLRDPKTMAVLVETHVKMDGQFDLGTVQAGVFRLIVARKLNDGRLGRMPLADQPKKMTCMNDSTCRIEAIQHLHGTDLPFEFCPPK